MALTTDGVRDVLVGAAGMLHTSAVPMLPVDSGGWSPSEARHWLAMAPTNSAATARQLNDWLAVRWPWQLRVYDSGLPPATGREWSVVVLECTDVMDDRPERVAVA